MSDKYQVHCDCKTVALEMIGPTKVHAFCHCADCRDLLQVPYHSILAWDEHSVKVVKGVEQVAEYQHPHKQMKRVFCQSCGEVLYNTNSKGWKLVSQLLFRKCNDQRLPDELLSNQHYFYEHRVIDIDDALPKR